MSPVDACGCEQDAFATVFDRKIAEGDRDRYQRNGPDRTTRMLVELLQAREGTVEGAHVLDVGGGTGVVDRELLRAGAERATLVDASPAYLEVARAEAEREGLADRMTFVPGDFTRVAPAIPDADVVTLDRVVCCYRDARALVSESSRRARRAYGLVMPRTRRLTRAAVWLYNLNFVVRRKAYRSFIHSTDFVDRLVAANGLRLAGERTTWFWRVVVYERDAAP
jgi:SAM-dependent methyltransferase